MNLKIYRRNLSERLVFKLKEQIKMLKIVIDFLDGLSEEQLNKLLEKKAKIKIELVQEERNKKSNIDIEQICQDIEKFQDTAEAEQFLTKLNLVKFDLKLIAKHYEIPLNSKETNANITKKIVETVVGSKLRFDALLNTNLRG